MDEQQVTCPTCSVEHRLDYVQGHGGILGKDGTWRMGPSRRSWLRRCDKDPAHPVLYRPDWSVPASLEGAALLDSCLGDTPICCIEQVLSDLHDPEKSSAHPFLQDLHNPYKGDAGLTRTFLLQYLFLFTQATGHGFEPEDRDSADGRLTIAELKLRATRAADTDVWKPLTDQSGWLPGKEGAEVGRVFLPMGAIVRRISGMHWDGTYSHEPLGIMMTIHALGVSAPGPQEPNGVPGIPLLATLDINNYQLAICTFKAGYDYALVSDLEYMLEPAEVINQRYFSFDWKEFGKRARFYPMC